MDICTDRNSFSSPCAEVVASGSDAAIAKTQSQSFLTAPHLELLLAQHHARASWIWAQCGTCDYSLRSISDSISVLYVADPHYTDNECRNRPLACSQASSKFSNSNRILITLPTTPSGRQRLPKIHPNTIPKARRGFLLHRSDLPCMASERCDRGRIHEANERTWVDRWLC